MLFTTPLRPAFCRAATLILTASIVAVAAGAHAQSGAREIGGSQQIGGQSVSTWARYAPDGAILSVGITLPYTLVVSPPATKGSGPAGAVAVIPFPEQVQDRTYFNHFELHWNPKGHRPACYMVPHYDFHFYAVPVDYVKHVGLVDSRPPDADHLAAGYFYPGPKQCIPQMGVHAAPPMDMAPGHPFSATMIAGYYGGTMNFVEPMITRAFLMRKKSFTMAVPRPRVIGRETLYPTKFDGTYDAADQSWKMAFSDFMNAAK